MSEYVYLNGKIVPSESAVIHVNDLGLLRGYGVFDFFRAIDGKPIFMEDHLDRFENSCHYLGMSLPFSRVQIKASILEMITKNASPILGIKLVCTGGYSDDGYTPAETPNLFMLAKPFTFSTFSNGIKLLFVEHQRDLPTIKTTNYVKPITLLPKLRAQNAEDVLYHHGGLVTESSRSNFFMIKNGVLITANAGILEGITRKRILSFAHEILEVEIRDVTVSEVLEADEIFLCGSTKRILPIGQIDDTSYPIGSLTTALYERLLKEEQLDK